MAIKTKIDKETFDALPDALKENYKERGGSYVLDMDEGEDLDVIRRAKDQAKQEARDAKARAKELEERLAAVEDNTARKSGDIEALDKSWGEKLSKTVGEKEEAINRLTAHLNKILVENKALEIATELSTVPHLFVHEVKARLQAAFDGDAAVTRVLDKSGQLSALTVDELKRELQADPKFAPVLIGSKATGSGASNGNAGGALGAKKLADMSGQERTELYKSDPAAFEALVKAAKSLKT